MDIVAFTGFKGSGKTTAAQAVAELDGWTKMSLADPLRDGVQAIFGFSDEQMTDRALKETPDPVVGVSYRRAAQDVGLFCRETYGEDFWIRVLDSRIKNTDDSVVIDDVRFLNEAEFVRSQGGAVIGIERPGVECDDDHPSETEMRDHWDDMVDGIIENGRAIEHLTACAQTYAKKGLP